MSEYRGEGQTSWVNGNPVLAGRICLWENSGWEEVKMFGQCSGEGVTKSWAELQLKSGLPCWYHPGKSRLEDASPGPSGHG